MIKRNEILIVTCTRESVDNFKNRPIYKSLNKLKLPYEVFYDNTKGLCECYNKTMKNNKNKKYFIFVHDDLVIEDLFLIEKLEKAFDKYDIIGLAGTKKWILNQHEPTIWNTGDRTNWSGIVNHTKDGKYWSSFFGPVPERCILLDGLFLAVNKTKCKDLYFDERFKFHHYDLDFCLQAKFNNCSCGTYPINVLHYGMGDWVNSKEWSESHQNFKFKWLKR